MNKLEWFIIWNISMSLFRNKIERNKQPQLPSILIVPSPPHSQIYAPKAPLVAARAVEGKYILIICASETDKEKDRRKNITIIGQLLWGTM